MPSAARLLSDREARDLAAVARALPSGWCCVVTPPHGQLVLLPRQYVRPAHRCYVADGALGVIYHLDSRRGVRIPVTAARPLTSA